ncbi:hypothetical protein A3H84_05115 [Candidatus Roizmanbacteria bacterium RIFCSPLOWO2_02_FULL_40_13]|nr:MAG: hypothetical protein A3H84_05115 [Candidatus Roizmanbacteria bacterium RIFCSPLOWO2_02_FULL_40_13]
MAKRTKKGFLVNPVFLVLFFVLLLGLVLTSRSISDRKTSSSKASERNVCKKVLFIGDSLMPITAQLTEIALKEMGYCVRALIPQGSGSGAALGSAVGINWQKTLPRMLDDFKPDILVGEFAGNNTIIGVTRGSTRWHQLSQQGILQLIEEIEKRNIVTYWVVPPKIQWACNPNDPYQNGLDEFRLWVRNQLPVLEPQLHMIDWSSFISPGDVYTNTLTVNDRTVTVRTTFAPGIGPDCIHFTQEGSKLVGKYTATAIQNEWRSGGNKSIQYRDKGCDKKGSSCCEYSEKQQKAIRKEYAAASISPSGYYYYYCRNKFLCQIDLSCGVFDDLLHRHPWAKGKNTKPIPDAKTR